MVEGKLSGLILIGGKSSRMGRPKHLIRLKTGETFVDGDETRILQGSEPYITTGYGTKGAQRRAFHAVKSSDGTI